MCRGNNKIDTFEEIEKTLLELIFLGEYVERRYVWSLDSYRNIIVIDKDESRLVECLKELKNNIDSNNEEENRWFGFTADQDEEGNTNFVLWIDIDETALGKHWYRIQAIKFDAKEIKLELKCLRKFHLPVPKFQDNIEISLNAFKEIMTVNNLVHTIRFGGVTFMLVLTFAVNAIIHIGDYLIQLIYALSTLINAANPVILGGFHFFAGCITGLFWFILALIKPTPPRFYRDSCPALHDKSRKF